MDYKKIVLRKGTDGILAAVLMLFILSGSVVATLAFRPLYYFDIGYLHIEEQSGYPREEICANYDALIDYNLSPAVKELRFPTLPMSDEGRIHFREVKNIFQTFERLLAATAVLAAAGIWYKHRRREYGYLTLAGALLPALLAAVGAALAVNWDAAFVMFHRIAFRNDYWLFDEATDPVITILPDTFFLHCAVMILALTGLGAALCLICGRIFRRKI